MASPDGQRLKGHRSGVASHDCGTMDCFQDCVHNDNVRGGVGVLTWLDKAKDGGKFLYKSVLTTNHPFCT